MRVFAGLLVAIIGCSAMAQSVQLKPLEPNQLEHLTDLANRDRNALVELTSELLSEPLNDSALITVAAFHCNGLLDSSQYQQVENTYQQYQRLFGQPDNAEQQIELSSCYAYSLDRQGRSVEAQALYHQVQQQFDGKQYPMAMSILLLRNSYLHNFRGDYATAVELQQQAMALYKSSKKDNQNYLMRLQNAMGNTYSYLKLYDKAKEAYTEALHWQKQLGDKLSQSIVLYNLANLEEQQGNGEATRHWAAQSRKLSEQIDDQVGIAYVDFMIAKSYALDGDFASALQLAAPLQNTFALYNEQDGEAALLLKRALWLSKLKQYRRAIELALQAQQMNDRLQSLKGQRNSAEVLSELYQETKQYQLALEQNNKLLGFSEQLYDSNLTREMAQLQTQMNLDIHERELQVLRMQSQLDKQALASATKLRFSLATILAILVLFVVTLSFALRRSHKLSKQLAHSASTDALTGLANRRVAMERLADQHALLVRHQQPFCIALLDVDHFKQINDNYGHHTGDQVLTAIAALMRAEIRQEDMACRYGGEEFLLLINQSDQYQSHALLERLRQKIAKLSTKFGGITITISIGYVQACSSESINKSLQRADKALYQAKALGRDRVILAEPEAKRLIWLPQSPPNKTTSTHKLKC